MIGKEDEKKPERFYLMIKRKDRLFHSLGVASMTTVLDQLMHSSCALQGSAWGQNDKIRTQTKVYSLSLVSMVFSK